MKEIIAIRNGYQEHQKWITTGICPCLTAAMGMGGGYTPVILFVSQCEDDIQKKIKPSSNLNRG